MESKCERCGYISPSKKVLIKHVKDEKMCPSILSTISHIDLLNKLQPPPNLTCKFCNLLCKSKNAHTSHIKYHCHKNPNKLDKKKPSSSDIASTSNSESNQNNTKQPSEIIRKYVHKDTSKTKGLFPFNKDVEWNKLQISQNEIMKCIINLNQGLVDIFILLHSHDEHKNIEWINDKLVVYDGKGWTELDETLLSTHLGFLFSYMEECWCDYLMDVRCDNITSFIDEETTSSIDDFFYERIVDEDSVLFHCGDIMYEYLETLKTC